RTRALSRADTRAKAHSPQGPCRGKEGGRAASRTPPPPGGLTRNWQAPVQRLVRLSNLWTGADQVAPPRSRAVDKKPRSEVVSVPLLCDDPSGLECPFPERNPA